MKSAYQVEELVPHAGRMILLSRILSYGEDWLLSEVDITADSMFANDRGVPSWVGLEYMAQTIGAYAGLQERLQGGVPKIGFLLGCRNYSVNGDCFAQGETFRIRAELDMVADNGLNVFNCELEGKDIRATAMVNVFQPQDADKFFEETAS